MVLVIKKACPADLRQVGSRATRQSAGRFIGLCTTSDTITFLNDSAWSLFDGNRLFGVCGYVSLRPGHGVCWAIFDDHVMVVPVHVLTGTIRKRMRAEMDRSGLHRLESSVDLHDRQALRWARLIGFETEGLMRQSGIGNQDQWLIARIKE